MSMESYSYYEVYFKGKTSKDWHELTIEHDRVMAIKHFTRLKQMGHQAKLVKVDVRKNVYKS